MMRRCWMVISLTALIVVGAGCGTATRSVTTTTRPHQTTTTTTLPGLINPVTAAQLAPSFGLFGLVQGAGNVELELTTDFVQWRNITPPVPDQGQYGGSAAIKDVFFLNPTDGWVVVGLPSSALELYRTTDGGTSWQDEGGVTSGGAAGTELVDFIDPSHGWREVIAPTAGSVSLSSSADGGQTWAAITNPDQWPSDGVLNFSSLSDGVLADTLPPNQSLVSEQPIADFPPLRETTDSGQTWHQATIDLPSGYAKAQSYDGLPTFSSPSNGVLPVVLFKQSTMSMAFFVTTDAGASWPYRSLLDLGFTAKTGVNLYNQLPSVAVADQNTWWVISAIRPNGTPTVHVTDDAGQSWTTVSPSGLPSTLSAPLPLGFAPLQATSSTTAWMMVGSECGLWGTTDGGRTWTPVCPS